MLYLRARKSTQVIVRKGHVEGVVLTAESGLHFVEGPKNLEDGTQVPGEIVGLEDDYEVNPDVWDVVRPGPDGHSWTELEHPVRGVTYVKPRSSNTLGDGAATQEELAELRAANSAMQRQMAELMEQLQGLTAQGPTAQGLTAGKRNGKG